MVTDSHLSVNSHLLADGAETQPPAMRSPGLWQISTELLTPDDRIFIARIGVLGLDHRGRHRLLRGALSRLSLSGEAQLAGFSDRLFAFFLGAAAAASTGGGALSRFA